MTVLGASIMNMTMSMGGGAGLALASVTPAQVRFNTADYRKLVTNPPPSASPSSARPTPTMIPLAASPWPATSRSPNSRPEGG
jgi:hypothetical protein